MAPRPILVTGATGLLCRRVLFYLNESCQAWEATGAGLSRVYGEGLTSFDITNESELTLSLDKIKPDVVIHSAAQKYPDKVEADFEAARVLNVEATRVLARLCAARSVLLIYVSTDYVFGGRPGEAPYETDAPTACPNKYGLLKREGELAVLDEFARSSCPAYGVCLRVPMLYGSTEIPEESAVNSLVDMVWNAQTKGTSLSVDHWSRRYPTNTNDVARVCRDLAAKYVDAGPQSFLPHTLHFTSGDCFTKYDMCCMYAEIMGMPTSLLHPVCEPAVGPRIVQRPYDCHLSTKALQDLGIHVGTCGFQGWWRHELRAFRQ